MEKLKTRKCLCCDRRFETSNDNDNRICPRCHEKNIELFEDAPEGNYGEGIYSVCPGEGSKDRKK